MDKSANALGGHVTEEVTALDDADDEQDEFPSPFSTARISSTGRGGSRCRRGCAGRI